MTTPTSGVRPSAPEPSVDLTWVGHATVEISVAGFVVVTDPIVTPRVAHLRRRVAPPVLPPVDVVVVSHLHMDHLHVKSLRLIGAGTRVIAPRGAAPLLTRIPFRQLDEVVVGDIVEVRPSSNDAPAITVEAVPADHSNRRGPHSRLVAEPVGYIVRSGTQAVYFAGDTDLVDGMRHLGPIDVALLPIWGWGPTLGEHHLDPARAATAAEWVQPSHVIPIHWGTYTPIRPQTGAPSWIDNPLDEFRAALADRGLAERLVALRPGESYDKALDVYYLAVAYISSMRTWRDPVAFQASRGLYLYRLVGVTLFELLHQRWLLLVFANTFEYFFIAYEAVRTRWNPARLSATAIVGMAGAIWIFVKLPQEWWIHIAKLDFTEFMGKRPWMWLVLGAVAIAAGVTGWLNRRRIPTPDWTFTVDVDRHLPSFGTPTRPRSIVTTVLVEKVVFLTLVCVIFAQILPGLRSSNLGVAIGVALLVVSNAIVSEVLYRRGHSWTSSAGSFLATLAINVGLVFVDVLLPGGGDRAPNLNTLFFVLLVSMLISLFDRMRATRGENDLRTSLRQALRTERRIGATGAA